MLSTGTKVLFRNHFIVMGDSARLAGVAFGNRISNLATSVHHRYSFVALMHVNIRRASSIGAPASLRALTHALEASRSSEDADVLVQILPVRVSISRQRPTPRFFWMKRFLPLSGIFPGIG